MPMLRKTFQWILKAYIWATYRLYNEFAWAYDIVSWFVSLGQWSKWRHKALEHVVGRRVLEIGFGTGELLIEMAGKGYTLVGLDNSAAMHTITRRKLIRHAINAARVRAKAQETPFRSKSFDSIISTFPAEYILHLETLYEAARLLRDPDPETSFPGGRLIIAGSSIHTSNPLLRQKMKRILGRAPGDLFSEFEKLAEKAGFNTKIIYEDDKWISAPVIILEKNYT
jgi:ubiquinone/menaquinone biosynthesis C-methylase UbiE